MIKDFDHVPTLLFHLLPVLDGRFELELTLNHGVDFDPLMPLPPLPMFICTCGHKNCMDAKCQIDCP